MLHCAESRDSIYNYCAPAPTPGGHLQHDNALKLKVAEVSFMEHIDVISILK